MTDTLTDAVRGDLPEPEKNTMSGWIKLQKDSFNGPEVRVMARRLIERYGYHFTMRDATVTQSDAVVTLRMENGDNFELMCLTVRGCLIRLWIYADTHLDDDDRLYMGIVDIDKLVGLTGFCEVMPAKWLKVIDPDGCVELPGYQEHNGSEARRKEQTAARNVTYRQRQSIKKQKKDKEERHAERHGVVTLASQDQDQDQDQESKNADGLLRSPPPLEEIQKIYPRRAGSQRWGDAASHYRARLREGHKPHEILAGIKRYALYVRAAGIEGTEKVQQAATFLGRNKGFEYPWNPPPKAESATDRLLRLNGLKPVNGSIDHEPDDPLLPVTR